MRGCLAAFLVMLSFVLFWPTICFGSIGVPGIAVLFAALAIAALATAVIVVKGAGELPEPEPTKSYIDRKSAAMDAVTNQDRLEKARGGDCNEQYYLAHDFENGTNGLPKDLAEAKFWFEQAAKNGHSQAKMRLLLLE